MLCRRGASCSSGRITLRRVICWALLVVACCLEAAPTARAQSGGESCDEPAQQPLLRGIHPPSGTAGLLFTVTGERLDQVGELRLVQGGRLTLNGQNTNSTVTTFRIESTIADNGPATLTLFPNNMACSLSSVIIELRRRGKVGRDAAVQL